MPVLTRHHAPGMPADAYDQIATQDFHATQRTADGFVAHYSVLENGGITVVESWASRDQHDAWFDDAVRPFLPPGTPEPTFVYLSSQATPGKTRVRAPGGLGTWGGCCSAAERESAALRLHAG